MVDLMNSVRAVSESSVASGKEEKRLSHGEPAASIFDTAWDVEGRRDATIIRGAGHI